MKQSEIDIIEKLNEWTEDKIQISKKEYSRFDAYNSKAIFEIKNRGAFYESTMIEFDKYSYNQMYSQINKLIFLYVVQMQQMIYIFNVTALTKHFYDAAGQRVTLKVAARSTAGTYLPSVTHDNC